ncbi:MAG: hypothetical protein ACI8WB_003496 [Phenylobacterium sp.]|jgi:hypothetical protein
MAKLTLKITSTLSVQQDLNTYKELKMKYLQDLKWALVLLSLLMQSVANAIEIKDFNGKLFFIAGTPEKHTTARFPTILYGLDKNSQLKRIRPITTQEQGSDFVRPYYEDGMVLVGNANQSGFFQLDYIDMNHVLQEKSYEIKHCADCSYSRSYHIVKNGRTQHWLKAGTMRDGKLFTAVYGLDFKTGSSVKVTDADLIYAKTNGASSGHFDGDDLHSLIVYDNRAFYHGGLKVDLGWSFPDIYKPNNKERFTQQINNSQLRVISPYNLTKTNKQTGGRQYGPRLP